MKTETEIYLETLHKSLKHILDNNLIECNYKIKPVDYTKYNNTETKLEYLFDKVNEIIDFINKKK